MLQNYNTYSRDDHRVWQILFERQSHNLRDKACTPYLSCLASMKHVLNAECIPDFLQLNEILHECTGWLIEVVPGHIPVHDFFRLLAQKRFPSSTWLRSMEQLDYLEEPDMFHDIFGHIPLLLDKEYSQFMNAIGLLGVKFSNNSRAVSALRSVYWFTIEFGLFRDGADRRIYGAGILSSYGESKQVMDTRAECQSFDIAKIIRTDFRTDEMQNSYFEASCFREFLECLDDLEHILCSLLSTPAGAA